MTINSSYKDIRVNLWEVIFRTSEAEAILEVGPVQWSCDINTTVTALTVVLLLNSRLHYREKNITEQRKCHQEPYTRYILYN